MNKLVREISGIRFACYKLNLAKWFYQRATSECPCGRVGADHYIAEMNGEQDLCERPIFYSY